MKKGDKILDEKRQLTQFESFVLCYLIICFTIIVLTTSAYLASLVQAIIRKPHDPKTHLHKIMDSVFFLLVRISDFLISLMISVIFFRLARKKKRSSVYTKFEVEGKNKKISNSFGTVDLKELLKNGSVKGG
jgi:flagellar biosynthesis protein FlhB